MHEGRGVALAVCIRQKSHVVDFQRVTRLLQGRHCSTIVVLSSSAKAKWGGSKKGLQRACGWVMVS